MQHKSMTFTLQGMARHVVNTEQMLSPCKHQDGTVGAPVTMVCPLAKKTLLAPLYRSARLQHILVYAEKGSQFAMNFNGEPPVIGGHESRLNDVHQRIP